MFEKHSTYILDDFQIANTLNEEAGIEEWDEDDPNWLEGDDIAYVFTDDEFVATYTHFIQLEFGRGMVADIINLEKRGYINDNNRWFYTTRLRVLNWLVKNFDNSDKNNVFMRIRG